MERRPGLANIPTMGFLLTIGASAIGLASRAPLAEEPKSVVLASPTQPDGARPDGCRSSSTKNGSFADWRVTRVEAGLMVTELGRIAEEDRYPICVVDAVTARNFELTIVMVPLDGIMDQAGGVIFRLVDDADYYLVRVNALEGDVRFFRVVAGVRTEIAGVAAAVLRGTHHVLGVKAFDDHFSVMLDGRPLFETIDDRFPKAGRIGIWSKSDSLTLFGNIEFREHD